MKLYLIRHSNAVDLGTSDYENDSQRPITEKGRKKAERIASALKGLGIEPDLIVSSPYVRARQTAEILAKGLHFKRDLAFSDCLLPIGDPDAILGEILEKFSVDELVLVGHEPCLGGLIGTLIAGNREININLKKGGVCCLSSDNLQEQPRAILEWMLTPKILSGLS